MATAHIRDRSKSQLLAVRIDQCVLKTLDLVNVFISSGGRSEAS